MNDNIKRPAFPVVNSLNERSSFTYNGLTKREYAAIAALQGLLGCDHVGNVGRPPEDIAKMAVNYADALLKELDQ